jgi:nickel-dependent lactate racemase
MKKSTVKLPSLLWYGNTGLELQFPEEWSIHVCAMPGANRPALSPEEIKGALSKPLGSKRISSLAAEREEAVIIFDDMTRPTRAYEIVPFILDELRKGGIRDDHIRFVDALGCHGADDRIDFSKKLGEEVVEQFPVYNHNPFYGVTEVGDTSRGTPVQVNSEVMECDLKIGVGCVVPHPMSGYGGGAKIILPGVTSFETTYHNHGVVMKSSPESDKNHPSIGWGKVEGNVMRLDVEESAKLAQLDIKVDALVNGRGENIALFAGDFMKEHREAVKMGRGVYETKPLAEPDIVIANTYAKANEAGLGLSMATASLKAGGTIVLVVNTPESLITHYMYGKFGKKRGGGLYSAGRRPRPANLGKLIIFSPHKVVDPLLSLGPTDSYTWIKTWPEVIEELKVAHNGGARVAVYPNAEIQCLPQA